MLPGNQSCLAALVIFLNCDLVLFRGFGIFLFDTTYPFKNFIIFFDTTLFVQTFRQLSCKNGDTVHVRKSVQPDPEQHQIYSMLNLKTHPGKVVKTIMAVK